MIKMDGQNNNEKTKTKVCFFNAIKSQVRCIWNKKVENTALEKLKQYIKKRHGIQFDNFWDMQDWSVKHFEMFWETMWHFYEIKYSQTYEKVVVVGRHPLDVEWFSGAKLNFAENCMRYNSDDDALIYVDNALNEERVSFAKLNEEVAMYAAAFKKYGLQTNDVVACWISCRKEVVYTFLAAVSVGAIVTTKESLYKWNGVAKCFNDLYPKFLLVESKYDDEGNDVLLETISLIRDDLKSLQNIIICSRTVKLHAIEKYGEKCIFLEDFLRSALDEDGKVPKIEFKQLPFNHPTYVVFTSGTTGAPKGIVHGCRVLITNMENVNIQVDLQKGDVMLNTYQIGWTGWYMQFAVLAIGATLLNFNYPKSTDLWIVMDKYNAKSMLSAPSHIEYLEKINCVPESACKLNHLQSILIGHDQAKPKHIDFLLNQVKKDLFIPSILGATELGGIMSSSDLNTPIYTYEFQGFTLGLDVKCFDEKGNSVVGKEGELVITTPYPSLSVTIWNDKDEKLAYDSYLRKYPGAFTQNDLCIIDPETKGAILTGRSDEMLMMADVNCCPSEIYSAIRDMPELKDYLCVFQENKRGDGRAVLFLQLNSEYKWNADLVQQVKKKILEELTVDYIPNVILQANEIPYNINGKRMELLVKKIIATNEIPDVYNLRNPKCLIDFINISELQNY